MRSSFENRRRRQGIYLFLGAYMGLMVTVIALELVRNHDFGGGFIW